MTDNRTSEQRLTIDCSGLSGSIKSQLNEQGYKLPLHATASLERTRRAIIQLRIVGILRDQSAVRAEKKFVSIVKRCLDRGY